MPDGIDLFNLIFTQILKIDPTLITRYTTLQDQILYLILIPHVIVLLFLYSFAQLISGGHKGFRNLLGIVGYLFLIIAGWYGKFLVPIFITWFQILLVITAIFFIGSRIIHPARMTEIFQVGSKIYEKAGEKGKAREELYNEKKALDQQIAELKRLAAGQPPNSPQQQYLYAQIGQFTAQRVMVESKLKSL